MIRRIRLWVTNDADLYAGMQEHEAVQIDYIRLAVFMMFHLAVLGVIYTGVSSAAVIVCLSLYFARMFFVTAFYHRYFSHRSYRANRLFQLLMGIAGCTAGQRGPLWWASHHRFHHVNSDGNNDPHSPRHGFLNSHMLWFLRKSSFAVKTGHIRDLMRYPELRILETIHWLPFILLGVACYAAGEYLASKHPNLETNGPQLLVWGYFISTVLLYHATYTINSLAHTFGSRRYNTRDDSRNNLFLALLTLGEGWHNNHHRYPASTRQGFYWWELDISYLMLKLMAATGLIRDMKPVPDSVLLEAAEQRP